VLTRLRECWLFFLESLKSRKEVKNKKAKGKSVTSAGGQRVGGQKKVEAKKKSNGNGRVSLKEIEEHWEELLSGVKPLNHSVGALLRACRPKEVRGESLVLEVFYPFHKERLETEKCRAIVEEVAAEILSSPVKIKCILGEKEKRAPQANSSPGSVITEEAGDVLKTAEGIFNEG
jgi:hypothetical protein